ncbi:uncharacterized protein DSM5745_07895 [Aspergillus mulundensis]|uniref:DUF7587 domain-containing protein n=1 Tax=Aspergillus mulundensis TaxID=1810919 RepID=A0A3D8RFA0_9EURO|nr:Uncharacterized protein DSM5745_07895 [Aspergillus mulundensis]RDW72723.1 Uncharacterized protein DSM5745_07895 [Aspergillus mulundensis]
MPGKYVDHHEEQPSLIFNPGPIHSPFTPLFNNNFTPRYLYRLVAPQSAGTTTSSTVVPPIIEGNAKDIFDLPAPKAATLLLNHLLWQRGHENGCNLMSWTSSLLFALQYALYRHRKDGDDLQDIQLIILDTTLFPAGTFIQDMEIMRAFAGADRRLQKFVEFRESEYYFGEYLTQGRLAIQNRCVCTSVQRMIELGLFDLQPALGDETQWQWWPKRVLVFREQFEQNVRLPTTDADVQVAVDIARQCFGGQWVVPGAIMLLALQPRQRDDAVILHGLKDRFSADEVRRAGLHRVNIDARRLPEVGQFKELVQSVQRSYALNEYDDLVGSVLGLSV